MIKRRRSLTSVNVPVLTDGLLEVVVKDDVLWMIQVSSDLGEVSSCETTGAVNAPQNSVRPKHFVLFRESLNDYKQS